MFFEMIRNVFRNTLILWIFWEEELLKRSGWGRSSEKKHFASDWTLKIARAGCTMWTMSEMETKSAPITASSIQLKTVVKKMTRIWIKLNPAWTWEKWGESSFSLLVSACPCWYTSTIFPFTIKHFLVQNGIWFFTYWNLFLLVQNAFLYFTHWNLFANSCEKFAENYQKQTFRLKLWRPSC